VDRTMYIERLEAQDNPYLFYLRQRAELKASL
jgi:hypothetical protein